MSHLRFVAPETAGLVSVIIPTRNGVRYLGEALSSIAIQTYSQWEVIVVEDGSNDGSEQLVREFAQEHTGHRVHYQRNATSCGASYSRNVAFQLAAGEWIAFLDCDDRWFPSHLQTCVKALEETGDDLAYSTVVMFADGTDHLIGLWGPTPREIASFPQSLFGRSYVTPSATVVRRSVIGEVGPWDAGYRYCEDAEFMLHAASLGKRFRYVGGVHCMYRKQHAGSTSQSMAGTIELLADVGLRYASIPEMRRRGVPRLIAKNLAMAGRLHARSDPKQDPSATRSRAATLYFKAWRLSPSRVKYLLEAIRYALRFGVSPLLKPLVRPNLPESDESQATLPEPIAPAVSTAA